MGCPRRRAVPLAAVSVRSGRPANQSRTPAGQCLDAPAAERIRSASRLHVDNGRRTPTMGDICLFSLSFPPRIAMRRLPIAVAALFLLAGRLGAADTPPEGITPVGPDGRKLNFDFETGTVQDWTAEG